MAQCWHSEGGGWACVTCVSVCANACARGFIGDMCVSVGLFHVCEPRVVACCVKLRAQALQALVEVLKDMQDDNPFTQLALNKVFHIVLMPTGPELFCG